MRAALRIAVVYGVVAATWILFSDVLLTSRLPSNVAAEVHSLKGICFVLVMSFLLFGQESEDMRSEVDEIAELRRLSAEIYESAPQYYMSA